MDLAWQHTDTCVLTNVCLVVPGVAGIAGTTTETESYLKGRQKRWHRELKMYSIVVHAVKCAVQPSFDRDTLV